MAISGTTATFLARRWGKRHVSGGTSEVMLKQKLEKILSG
jgi:hypothetical protein